MAHEKPTTCHGLHGAAGAATQSVVSVRNGRRTAAECAKNNKKLRRSTMDFRDYAG
jgi:hypothetical protein